jgi:hypothetical protein
MTRSRFDVREKSMEDQEIIAELAANLREIYRSGISKAESRMEDHLESRLEGLPTAERVRILETLHSEFPGSIKQRTNEAALDNPTGAEVYAKIYSLVFAKKVEQKDLSSSNELLTRMTESLKTIFDAVNELLNATNVVLNSGIPSEQTIRHLIGLHMRGGNQTKSLEKYISRIKIAILSSHDAYKEAVLSRVMNILLELSPDCIEKQCGKSIRFGPFRKAELFDMYQSRFNDVRKQCESGKFMEEFLTEFESALQRRLPPLKGSAG